MLFRSKIKKKILLVQSRGNLWGAPKGSKELNETIKECAIREVFEETGLVIENHMIDDNKKLIYNNAHYYYLNMPQKDVKLNNDYEDNDVSGIGWINTECLVNMIHDDQITLNYHCKLLLEYFLKIYL